MELRETAKSSILSIPNYSLYRILYSGKFSRGPIFTVFADDLTVKIKPAK